MSKIKRNLIVVDEERCDGCGNCVPACAEGALQIVEGKARLVQDSYCDGLGACLGECPRGALAILELEAEEFDAPQSHTRSSPVQPVSQPIVLAACPPPLVSLPPDEIEAEHEVARGQSELRQWPVQLHLLPPQAPFFQGADLTLIADCVPFAYPNLHADYMKGSAIAVGCPKLDDAGAYVRKLTQILVSSDVKSLRVLHMEVPCCGGLVRIARQALQNSGKNLPFESVLIHISQQER